MTFKVRYLILHSLMGDKPSKEKEEKQNSKVNEIITRLGLEKLEAIEKMRSSCSDHEGYRQAELDHKRDRNLERLTSKKFDALKSSKKVDHSVDKSSSAPQPPSRTKTVLACLDAIEVFSIYVNQVSNFSEKKVLHIIANAEKARKYILENKSREMIRPLVRELSESIDKLFVGLHKETRQEALADYIPIAKNILENF